MKLTNHKKENSYTIDTFVMRGTITMTCTEYENAIMFLLREYQKAVKKCDTYTRDSLSGLKLLAVPRLSSLGVCATKLIVKKYGLTGYKDQNYGIRVTDGFDSAYSDKTACAKCGNPNTMYFCNNDYCNVSQEKQGKCFSCGSQVEVDKDYHLNCK